MADNQDATKPFEFLGFEIKRKQKAKEDFNQSFAPPKNNDGAIEIELQSNNAGVVAGGIHSHLLKYTDDFKTQSEVIHRYRRMSWHPEVTEAINNICNDAITDGIDKPPVAIRLEQLELSDTIKNKLLTEFDGVLNLLKFNKEGYDRFKDFYVDGRIVYHTIVDKNNLKSGIKELRQIDPVNIRKIREIRKKVEPNGIDVVDSVEEYYLYTEIHGTKRVNQQPYRKDIKIHPNAIVNVTSGLLSYDKRLTLGHLHPAIKALNDYVSMENSAVIYRLTRAPERRIFYIDVGNLPKSKAEQYVTDMMNRYKNKMVYDASTGEVENNARHMTMLEDFWLPRREGGKGTEITTLQGGQNLGEITDIEFFQKKLYKSLNVPYSRLDNQTRVMFGRQAEIQRDELNFSKFISRLRKRFSDLFTAILEKQVLLKGIMTQKEWNDIAEKLHYDYLEDAYITESKETDILMGRLEALNLIEPHIGKYYSVEWVRKSVLRQSEDEIKKIDKQIKKEQEMIAKIQASLNPQAVPTDADGNPQNDGSPEVDDRLNNPFGGTEDGMTADAGYEKTGSTSDD